MVGWFVILVWSIPLAFALGWLGRGWWERYKIVRMYMDDGSPIG